MAEIINLRMMRKRKQRAEKQQVAEENRTRSGLTKGQRLAQEVQRKRDEAHHAAHFIKRNESEDDA